MKNIILTSNGFINSSPRSKEIDELFKTIANGKKVMILGNATLGGSNASQREPVVPPIIALLIISRCISTNLCANTPDVEYPFKTILSETSFPEILLVHNSHLLFWIY